MCSLCSLVAGGSFRHNGMTQVGVPVIVTFGFPEADALEGRRGAADGALRSGFREAAARLEEVAGIVMVEVDGDADPMIRVSYADSADTVSWATYPQVTVADMNPRADVAVTPAFASFAPGGFGFEALLHYLGHAVGLKHPFEGDATVPPNLDNTNMTVMSYTTAGGPKSAYQALDVRALQALYGGPDAMSGVSVRFAGATDTLVARGSAQRDVIVGVNGPSVLRGEGGPDILLGRDAADTLAGGAGNDRLLGLGGPDRLSGGGGNDLGRGFAGEDTLTGSAGSDSLFGGDDEDLLDGGAGNDLLVGQRGDDGLMGLSGNDHLLGGPGNDRIGGHGGNDTLRGQGGDDLMVGGAGRDVLFGGAGADTFVLWPDDDDVVVDFEPGADVLDVVAFGLSEAEARARLVAWRDSLYFDTGTGWVRLVGEAATPPSGIEFLV